MTEEAPAPVVVTERVGPVLVITLNRPAARNAVDREVAQAVAAAVDLLDTDPELRVGILSGAGGYFCAGMDLKAFLRGESPRVAGRGFAGLVEATPAKP
ncbi:MAG: enoyl-CoA hydratase, partial [Rhodococcus sp. (in: high G+C Gram-positive bacteria)]